MGEECNRMPEIAVLMPVHNAGRFVREAVASLQRQTFQDFVLFACDDGSADDSWDLLQEMARNDPRIRLLRNPQNLGITATLNRLWREAGKGEGVSFCARMDADDIALPDRLETQRNYLLVHPEIHAVGCFLEIIDEKGCSLGCRRYPETAEEVHRALLLGNPLPHPALLLRPGLYLTMEGYREIPGAEDYDLWLRAAAAGYHFANIPRILLQYRISTGQIKQRSLKPTLRSTLRLQRRYLFRKEFFSLSVCIHYAAGQLLLLLPDRWVMELFMKLTVRRQKERKQR